MRFQLLPLLRASVDIIQVDVALAADATVTKEVSAYALMLGIPTSRAGWMSKADGRFGDDLIRPIEGTTHNLITPDKIKDII